MINNIKDAREFFGYGLMTTLKFTDFTVDTIESYADYRLSMLDKIKVCNNCQQLNGSTITNVHWSALLGADIISPEKQSCTEYTDKPLSIINKGSL